MIDGQSHVLAATVQDPVAALLERLAGSGNPRLAEAVGAIGTHLHDIVAALRPTPAEFRALLDFLTDVGHHTDARRHEWLLLADVLGVSRAIDDLNAPRVLGATPSTSAGPFFRPDAPALPRDGNLSRDGAGEPLVVAGRVRALSGAAVQAATVEIWHANADGLYENQDPDRQPEFNLRGQLTTDEAGRFRLRTIKPGGYSIPRDGPVAALLGRLGLPLERPAHIGFRVSAKGHRTLTTQIFDRADPAIGRDAIFGVKPELLAEFRSVPTDDGRTAYRLDIELVLCPEDGSAPHHKEGAIS